MGCLYQTPSAQNLGIFFEEEEERFWEPEVMNNSKETVFRTQQA